MTDNGAKCSGCPEEYGCSKQGQLDLRLRRKKTYQLQYELGTSFLPGKELDFKILIKNTSSPIDFDNIRVPLHLSKELISYFPKAKQDGDIMLDLGCGDAVHREVCEHAGFEYLGLDYDSSDALILGDAHALPFKDNSFSFMLSVAVLEHIRYPFVMMKEAYRVLKPGCKLIGTVAFLEPLHGVSFYHHTHLGTFNSLQFAGFNIEHIASNPRWPGLKALASMKLFPHLPQQILDLLILPLYWLHRAWWKLGYFITRSEKSSEQSRILHTTGSFSFIAHKPDK
ncbi:MAG: class I SAM-dependent methyltransferase [Candidatus Omnitrophota bacterium]